MKIRDRKSILYACWRGRKTRIRYNLEDLIADAEAFEMTEEDRAWDKMVPVGHEFGSPDFERIERTDLDIRKLRRATRKLRESTRKAEVSISAELKELKGIIKKPFIPVSIEDMKIERNYKRNSGGDK